LLAAHAANVLMLTGVAIRPSTSPSSRRPACEQEGLAKKQSTKATPERLEIFRFPFFLQEKRDVNLELVVLETTVVALQLFFL
jgi:hypothetical protein